MYSLIWPPKEPKPWPLRFSSDLSQKKLAFITMTPLYLVIGDGYTPPFFLHHLKPQIVVTDFDFEIPYQTLITMKDIGLRRYIYNGTGARWHVYGSMCWRTGCGHGARRSVRHWRVRRLGPRLGCGAREREL
ncbi:hypothetical protein ES332_A03G119200v1 [Gossypium tomentosum]|uniref:Uncharacterized protein n=1 Tax=Gossypium tomentosum TaxID=34277 RepID=A0A5D2R8W7_GOSTO|nr:hypothetical protein ES332_A03G119200v1 [Gossypium tomentosum]